MARSLVASSKTPWGATIGVAGFTGSYWKLYEYPSSYMGGCMFKTTTYPFYSSTHMANGRRLHGVDYGSNCSGTPYGTTSPFYLTGLPAVNVATNVTATYNGNNLVFNWANNESTWISSYKIEEYNGSTWSNLVTGINKTGTTHTILNQNPYVTRTFRLTIVYNTSYFAYSSNAIAVKNIFSVPTIVLPSNVTATSATINWWNNSTTQTNVIIQKYVGGIWINEAILSPLTESYDWTGLTLSSGASFIYRVGYYLDSYSYYEYALQTDLSLEITQSSYSPTSGAEPLDITFRNKYSNFLGQYPIAPGVALYQSSKIDNNGYVYLYTDRYDNGNTLPTYQSIVSRLIRIKPNGDFDNTFKIDMGGFNAEVLYCDIQNDSKVVVGGSFTTYRGTVCNHLIRLNTDGTIDNSFNASGATSNTSPLLIQRDGKIIYGVKRYNTDGTLDASYTGYTTGVKMFQSKTTDKIYILNNNVYRLNSDGTLDNTFTPVHGGTYGGNDLSVNDFGVFTNDGIVVVSSSYLRISSSSGSITYEQYVSNDYWRCAVDKYDCFYTTGKEFVSYHSHNPNGSTKATTLPFIINNYQANVIDINDSNVALFQTMEYGYDNIDYPYLVKLNLIKKLFYAPVLTLTDADNTHVDLSWTDSNSIHSGTTYEIFRNTNNTGYANYDEVSGLTYTDSTITIDNEYTWKVRTKVLDNGEIIYSPFSNEIAVKNGVVYSPTNCVIDDITYTTATLTWVNNNLTGVTGNYIKVWNGISYDIVDTLPSTQSTYNLINLYPNSEYIYIVVAFNNLVEAKSSDIIFNTLDPRPKNVHYNTNTLLYTDVVWDLLNPAYGTSIEVRIKKHSENIYTTLSTLAYNATSYRITGLTYNEVYDLIIVSIGSEFISDIYEFTTPEFVMPPSFCNEKNYTITDTTCGNSDGKINISDQHYLITYDFIITDVLGNVYNINPITGELSGLTANWYFINATPKQQFQSVVTYGSCFINWLELTDTDTTITLTDTKVKPAVCGGFGGSMGRIIYDMSDSSGATGWTFTLYDDKQNKVNQQVLSAITTIVYSSKPGIYYGVLENNLGCTYLIDLTEVTSTTLTTVPEITDIFITPWDSTIEYNYYDNTSDDWYQVGIDTQQFTSTKIKEYLNLIDYWYRINLVTATVIYSQSLSRSQNGLTFNETITLNIPKAENSKWKELTSVLNNRYIVVFKDANDNWWTMGYRSGTTVKSYQLNTNMYTISFNSPAVSKMLTAIDKTYVKNNIL